MRAILVSLWLRLVDRVGPTAIKYTAVSAISVAASQIILFVLYGIIREWSATTSNIITTAITAVPAYYLNRAWAWGKTGRSHFAKEVVPFWALTFAGLALSLWAVSVAHHLALRLHMSHLGDALFVNGASLMAFGVLWIGKFLVLNRYLFVDNSQSDSVDSKARVSGGL